MRKTARSLVCSLIFALFAMPLLIANAGYDDIQVVSHNMILLPSADSLEVREVIVLDNLGDAYNGEDNTGSGEAPKAMAEFILPVQATDFEVMQGLREGEFTLSAEKLEVFTELPSGETTIAYRYYLPNLTNGHYTLPLSTTFYTRELLLLVPTDAEVSAGDLSPYGAVEMTKDLTFNQYYSANLSPGSRREISIQSAVKGADRLSSGFNGAYHNPSHLRFWNRSPFRRFEPHLFLAFIILVPLTLISLYARKLWQIRKNEQLEELDDQEERIFQNLHRKMKLLEKKLEEVESGYIRGEIGETRHQVTKATLKAKMAEIEAKMTMFWE